MRGSYFDHNATTPLDPEVREAMLPWLGGENGGHGCFGNPSSVHRFGQAAREAVEAAREEVARLLDCRTPEEIVFLASGTEGNNAVVASHLAEAAPGDRIVASAVEHPSVAAAARVGGPRAGVEIVLVPPEADGVVSVARMVDAARPG